MFFSLMKEIGIKFGKNFLKRRKGMTENWRKLRNSWKKEKKCVKLGMKFFVIIQLSSKDMIMNYVMICLIINMGKIGNNIMNRNFNIKKTRKVNLRVLYILFNSRKWSWNNRIKTKRKRRKVVEEDLVNFQRGKR